MNMLFALVIGAIIGISLGLFGGGGSVLTVPALVYLLGQTPHHAITASLALVGANSFFGATLHRHACQQWWIPIYFGGAGMLGAFFAAGFSRDLPASILLIIFAILMLVVAGFMLFGNSLNSPHLPTKIAPRWKVILVGLLVGAMTGFLGVGGGFLILPALVLTLGVPVSQAVGMSLMVITANSLSGLLGHLPVDIELSMFIPLLLAGLVGVWLGKQMGMRLPVQQFRVLFAVLICLIALFILLDTILHKL
ncbi:MAG TPA: sulfite exporter TauE/SafE family protein [Anaerolineales bacterium]|nr:sulfite exporter TauE/SafE family protein [Anaerolineales bacterium]